MRLTRFLRMGGGGHGHAHSESFHGFHAPHVDSRYKTLATGIGAVAWFWIFYRASQDGAALIGLHHPWEGHGHGHAHGEAHGHEEHHGEALEAAPVAAKAHH